MYPTTQLEAFLGQIPEQLKHFDLPGDEPRAVFKTPLKLDKIQEDALVDHCLTRIVQLEQELGRTWVQSPDWYRSAVSADNHPHESVQTFFGSRALWDMIYAMRMDWRSYVYGGIYEHSNVHLPLTHRYVRQMSARANNYFFGTDPWFGISGVGNDDADRARMFEQWTRWGFRRADAAKVLEQAVEFAFVRGECILKTSWAHRADYYQAVAEVAVQEGDPLVAMDGDYIYRTDMWMRGPEGDWVLARDGQTTLPDGVDDPVRLVFANELVDKVRVRYSGLDVAIPNYLDVLVSRFAPSIEEADFVCHRYDRTAIDLAGEYLEAMRARGDEEAPRVIDLLRRQSVGAQGGDSAQFSDRPELGEGFFAASNQTTGKPFGQEPVVRVAECYLHYYVPTLRRQANIVALVDVTNRRLILADYVANYTPNGKRPFAVLRPMRVDNRWHGVSLCEAIWRLNENIDLQFARLNESNKSSGLFKAWRPTDFYESDSEHPSDMTINPDTVYTMKPGTDPDKAFYTRPVVDYKTDALLALIELLMQVQQQMTGVASANDAQMAGLETSKLATGIRHLEKQNQEQFAPFLSHLQSGIEDVLRAGIDLMLANAPEQETIRWRDGDATQAAIIHKTELQDFDYDLRLELSRYRAEQQSVQNMEGISLMEHYGMQLPEVRAAIRRLVERQLELYEIDGAAAALDLLDAMMPLPVAGAPPSGSNSAVQSPERKLSAEV